MKQFRVTVPFAVFVTIEVEAESKEDALEIGADEAYISAFCGNGGVDKLIGVYKGSIEASDEPLEIAPFSIDVEELSYE